MVFNNFEDNKIPENLNINSLKSKNTFNILLINALINNIPDAIYFKDMKSRFVLINKSCASKFRINTAEEAIGKTDFDYFTEEHARQAYNDEQNIIKTGKPIINIEEKETWPDNKVRWGSTTKMPLLDETGITIGTFGITRDITENKKADEKIEFLSFHDKLTGLYNRAYLEEEIKRLDTGRQLPISIIMGDINGLKTVNDTKGHYAGDKILRKIAEVLKESFRSEDIIARWGGDEFIGILTKTPRKDALIIVKRIKKSCRTEHTSEIPLSISFGISTKKNSFEDLENVIKDADSDMYKSKLIDTNNLFASTSYSKKEDKEINYYNTTDKYRRLLNKFYSLFLFMNEGVAIHEMVYDENSKAINYKIIEVNKAYEKILSLSKKKILGKTATEAYGTSLPPFINIYNKVSETGKPVKFDAYFEPIKKHFSISVFSLYKTNFVTVFSDITERKEIELLQNS